MKEIIWDQWGMLLQTGDGGDTAANMGTYHIFLETRRRIGASFNDRGPWPYDEKQHFKNALALLETPTKSKRGRGRYRRHPDPSFWGARCNTMSRDQTIPLLGAMALYGMKGHVLKYMLGHALRLFLFTTNTTPNWSDPVLHHPDKFGWGAWQKVKFFFGWRPGFPVYATKLPDFTDPEFWALELRGIYHWLLWPVFFPLLCLFDLQTLLGSFNKVVRYAKNPKNSDDRNHVNVMVVGLQVCRTPVMKWAAKVYSKRPCAELIGAPEVISTDDVGNLIYAPPPSGPQSALDHYYRAENSPPFNVLGRPIIMEYFE